MQNSPYESSIKVYIGPIKPFSLDPLLYDHFVHHYAFTSVLSPLVSLYSCNKIDFKLISLVENFNNFKEWKITIRDDIFFSDGSKITAKDIYLNFKRVALVKKLSDSKSGLLEFLMDLDNLENLDSKFEGINYSQNFIEFKFMQSIPDFLKKVAFNIYAIAHPSSYDSIDGSWLENLENHITSGDYKIKNSHTKNKKNIILDLVNNLSDKIKTIFINSGPDNFNLDYDIIIGRNTDTFIDERIFNFNSGPESYIRYLRVQKEFNLQILNTLKLYFYQELMNIEDKNFLFTTSFFPLKIKNVKNFSIKNSNPLPLDLSELKIYLPPLPKSLIKFSSKLNSSESIKKSFEKLGEKFNINIIFVNEQKEADIYLTGTGISLEDPNEDIRFMFNSKHGIQLPDPTNKITSIIQNKDFEALEINQILWNDSIIWPIEHYAMGFWLNTNSKIYTIEFNTALPPIDFSYLKKSKF